MSDFDEFHISLPFLIFVKENSWLHLEPLNTLSRVLEQLFPSNVILLLAYGSLAPLATRVMWRGVGSGRSFLNLGQQVFPLFFSSNRVTPAVSDLEQSRHHYI